MIIQSSHRSGYHRPCLLSIQPAQAKDEGTFPDPHLEAVFSCAFRFHIQMDTAGHPCGVCTLFAFNHCSTISDISQKEVLSADGSPIPGNSASLLPFRYFGLYSVTRSTGMTQSAHSDPFPGFCQLIKRHRVARCLFCFNLVQNE